MGRATSASATLASLALIVPFVLLSGCMGLASDDSSGFDLNVEADSQYGMILTSYEDGMQKSSSSPVITFDFSESANYGHGSSFGVVPGDGREPITTDSVDATEIAVEFTFHGLYSVTVFGIDQEGHREDQVIEVMIEQHIDWYENDTGTPEEFVFDSTPGNEGPIPSYFLLNSTVKNPSFIEFDGRDVEVRWDVVNQEGVCQTAGESIDNGDTGFWKTLHFGPLSIHEIHLVIEDGQDRIDVHHSLQIIYSESG
tara:strand:- start:6 stop:770 length:765 start_codon:yes stop_codon:yes gene_type:complete